MAGEDCIFTNVNAQLTITDSEGDAKKETVELKDGEGAYTILCAVEGFVSYKCCPIWGRFMTPLNIKLSIIVFL